MKSGRDYEILKCFKDFQGVRKTDNQVGFKITRYNYVHPNSVKKNFAILSEVTKNLEEDIFITNSDVHHITSCDFDYKELFDVVWYGKPGRLFNLIDSQWKNHRYKIDLDKIIEKGDFKGYTPIMLAICRGHLPMIDALVRSGCKLDYASKEGFNLLVFMSLNHPIISDELTNYFLLKNISVNEIYGYALFALSMHETIRRHESFKIFSLSSEMSWFLLEKAITFMPPGSEMILGIFERFCRNDFFIDEAIKTYDVPWVVNLIKLSNTCNLEKYKADLFLKSAMLPASHSLKMMLTVVKAGYDLSINREHIYNILKSQIPFPYEAFALMNVCVDYSGLINCKFDVDHAIKENNVIKLCSLLSAGGMPSKDCMFGKLNGSINYLLYRFKVKELSNHTDFSHHGLNYLFLDSLIKECKKDLWQDILKYSLEDICLMITNISNNNPKELYASNLLCMLKTYSVADNIDHLQILGDSLRCDSDNLHENDWT